MLASSVISAYAADFSDLPSDHWAYSYVDSLVSAGTINGFEDGTFRPTGTVTRAEFVKMLDETFGLTSTAPINYSDVKTDDWFHTYYMTVSGHLEYNWVGNAMAIKNKQYVENLTCSETLKAYYACNIELDRAMEKLLAELNAAGVADKTVISIAPDHYPYGLEQPEGDKYAIWEEMLGHPVETNFELYESCWLLYCQGTKDAPTIEKPCSSIDMLPTVLNLFGFEYDSRLIIGSDVLSTAGGLVIFGNRSFISDMGKYNTQTGTFTLADGKSFKDEQEKTDYIKGVRAIVDNKFTMSKQILEEDYYGYVFGK